jgi:hypothetical protein
VQSVKGAMESAEQELFWSAPSSSLSICPELA